MAEATISGKGVVTPQFPAFPPSREYDPDLEFLCRTAAWVSATRGEAPLSFTALLIAFLFGEDPVSVWFQAFITIQNIDRRKLLDEKQATDASIKQALRRAGSQELPPVKELFSTSARNVFSAAANIAISVTPSTASGANPRIGARHVLAAYAFRTPPDHLDQLRGWGFVIDVWQAQMLEFLRANYSIEPWDALLRPNATTTPGSKAPPNAPTNVTATFSDDAPLTTPTAEPSAGTASFNPDSIAPDVSPTTSRQAQPRGPLVGRYTSDDPYATADDLLDIEHEASAFARIVAARSIRPPLAIGIFGEWGSGKTYFMRRIQSYVEQLRPPTAASEAASLFYRDIVQIRFNAWHYIETNLWASLVEYIFSALDSWIQHQAGSDQSRTDLIFNRLATAQQLQIDALENIVTRRAQQHSAELRAQHAREEYADALARSTRVRPDAYFHALLDTFLAESPAAKDDLKKIATGLGIPRLEVATERLTEVLTQARSETGRTRLLARSVFAKLGTWPGILTILTILIILPAIVPMVKLAADWFPSLAWVKTLHDTNLQVGTVLIAAAAIVRYLRAKVTAALDRLTLFDQKLQASIDQQLVDAKRSPAVQSTVDAEKELQKCKQAVETAERGLAEADARLATARQEFESGTARGRLNAFIRAKVTDGDYAKHLGIIASIRKDFVQLASLMGNVNDSSEEQRERNKLRQEATLRVRRFVKWLGDAKEVRMTVAEIRGLFALLEPADAETVFDECLDELKQRFDGPLDELTHVKNGFAEALNTELPRFSRIVLYIDDLDRCPPIKVVDVLQAVHLLLCFPLFVVIVAVDARWVSRALHERFPGLLIESGSLTELRDTDQSSHEKSTQRPPSSGASSDDYLEKIFQIPYWVRPMDAAAAKLYVQKIAGTDRAVSPASPPAGLAAQPPVTIGLSNPPDVPTIESSQVGSSPAPVPGAPIPTLLIQNEPPIQAPAVGMTLSDWEIESLNAFAPYIGRTPRHAIRFVNVYRLIKTSLSIELIAAHDIEHGDTPASRTLIPQLAIVTGAPVAATEYFRRLMIANGDELATDFVAAWIGDSVNLSLTDGSIVQGVLNTLLTRESSLPPSPTPLRVKDLRFMAPTVQRYSFTARFREISADT